METINIDRLTTSYYYENLDLELPDFGINKDNIKNVRDDYFNKKELELKLDYKDPDKTIKKQIITILFNKLFENSYINILQSKDKYKRPLILFPTFENDPKAKNFFSKNKVLEKYIQTNSFDSYKDREGRTIDSVKIIDDKFAFIPVFSDYKETIEDYKTRLDTAIINIKDIIKKKQSDSLNEKKTDLVYTNIIYMINNDNEKNFFTSMYENKELNKEKIDILNNKLKEIIERSNIGDKQSLRLGGIKNDLIKSLTKDYFIKELKNYSKSQKDETSLEPYSNNKIIEYQEKIVDLIEKINEEYKKKVDKKYLALATSQDDATFLRIFYRINTDKDINYNIINPGNEYLYKLQGLKIKKFNDKLDGCDQNILFSCGYRGLINKVPQYPDRYKFQLHNKYTKEAYNKYIQQNPNGQNPEDSDSDDEEDIEKREKKREEKESKYISIQIDVKYKNGYIQAKQVGEDEKGIVEFYKDLHIYESYKWFKFNDLDGRLSAETKINTYKNMLFNKDSLIKFLTYKNIYNNDTKLPYEFLKINSDRALLLEYSGYIYSNFKQNIYKKTTFGISKDTFNEKCKKELLEIIFPSNQLIYFGGGVRSKDDKKDTTNNYKILSYQYFPISLKKDGKKIEKFDDQNKSLISYFNSTLYSKGGDEEFKYCKHHKFDDCEFKKEKIKENEDRIVVILDITKESGDINDFKRIANCKRLKQTIKREIRDIFKPIRMFIPFSGGTKKRKRSRRTRRKRRIKNV